MKYSKNSKLFKSNVFILFALLLSLYIYNAVITGDLNVPLQYNSL